MHWLEKLLCHFSVSACSGLTQLLTLFHNMSWYRQAILKRALRLTIIFISSAIHRKAEPIKQAKYLVCVPFCSLSVLWKSGCFHFLMKGKYYIFYSNPLPRRFCFKLFLEGCCSSLLHRQMHNMEIYMCWTMPNWPWKNRCTAGIVSDKCRWRNRNSGSTGDAYSLPGCISAWRSRGLVLRKANLSFLWLQVNAVMLYHPEGSASQYLTPLIWRVSSSHCASPWLSCNRQFCSLPLSLCCEVMCVSLVPLQILRVHFLPEVLLRF